MLMWLPGNICGDCRIQNLSHFEYLNGIHCTKTNSTCLFSIQLKLVTVSGDMTAKLWDASRGAPENPIGVFKGHGRSVKCIQFNPNTSDEFATGSRENSICLWDVREPSKVTTLIVMTC